jgi:hypothetical protein
MYVYVCICMCMYVYVCICMHMYVYVCICMYIYVYVCICMHMYVCVCICMYMYVDVNATYIYTHQALYVYTHQTLCAYTHHTLYVYIISNATCIYLLTYTNTAANHFQPTAVEALTFGANGFAGKATDILLDNVSQSVCVCMCEYIYMHAYIHNPWISNRYSAR